MPSNGLVGYDHHLAAAQQRLYLAAGALDQPRPDENSIGAIAQLDPQPLDFVGHLALCLRRRCRERAGESRDGAGHRQLRGTLATLDRHICFGVDRIALLDQLAKNHPGIPDFQQRPIAAVRHSGYQNVEIRAQPQRDAAALDYPAGHLVHEGAAARGQYVNWLGEQPGDDPALSVAERPLSAIGKNLLDALASGHLDLMIRIEERQIEPRRQPTTDLGFSCPHQTDKDDGSAWNKPARRSRSPLRYRCVNLHSDILRAHRSFSRCAGRVLAYPPARSSIDTRRSTIWDGK